ncbi:MAG: hypothetical protein RLY31_1768 [Bacteroidota bacterium]|jgi:uncharacterized protein (TIGR03032 family)
MDKNTEGGPPPPFSCSYTPGVPELLYDLGCTLVLSTFQAGKVIFLSAADRERLAQLPRNFPKPMGIALRDDTLAVACLDEVLVLVNSPELAWHYPRRPETYDALFLPRLTYHTGQLDVHDLDWGADGELLAVNTAFSCLVRIDGRHSFTPIWQPPFISRLASDDRCHLNGMALDFGRPRFATAFSATDEPQGWRPGVTTHGVLLDIPSGEIVASSLPMPHSPRLFDGELFLLLSATGELVRVDTDKGSRTVVRRFDGFVRGLCRMGDYLFVGRSKLRKGSSTFGHLPFAERARSAGVSILHLPTGALVGDIHYLSSVDEIYDVQVIPGVRRPGILNTEIPDHKLGLSTPELTFWARNTTADPHGTGG